MLTAPTSRKRPPGSFIARKSPPSVTLSAPSPIGAPGVCRLDAFTTRSSGTVRWTSMNSAPSGPWCRRFGRLVDRRLVLDLLRRIRRRPGECDDAIEVDVAGGDAEKAADARRRERAADLECAFDADVAQLVVDDLEVVGGDIELHRFQTAPAVPEIAAQRQRVEVIVENGDRVDVHAIRLHVDLSVDVGVTDAGLRTVAAPSSSVTLPEA